MRDSEAILVVEDDADLCHLLCELLRTEGFDALPAWARQTLAKHEKDPRVTTYTREELENAKTHDPYWNAAQRESPLSESAPPTPIGGPAGGPPASGAGADAPGSPMEKCKSLLVFKLRITTSASPSAGPMR